MTQKHTPTPYRINDNDKRQVITGDRTGVIATCQSRENAAFIVSACNSHDALVEALKDVLPKIKLLGAWKEAEKIEAALALVEGK